VDQHRVWLAAIGVDTGMAAEIATPAPGSTSAADHTEIDGEKRSFLTCATLSHVEDEIDYTKHSEPELVDMFGRLDPRYAPAECTRLAILLTARGYIVTDGTTGPGSAAPSPEKLEKLIGSTSPFECKVEFGPNKGFLSVIGWTPNQIGFSGSGTLVTDGIFVWISGRVVNDGPLLALTGEYAQLACHKIANVESADRVVRFEYNVLEFCGDAISLWLADATAAARLVRVLPKRRTKDFKPHFSQ
jgi:hypothetical protein